MKTTDKIESLIEAVKAEIAGLGDCYEVREECDWGWIVSPKNANPPSSLPPRFQDKRIALTIQAITHGNEIAGLGVVRDLLGHIKSGVVRLEMPTAFVLGNVAAAREDKRFLERDLNRSFMNDDTQTVEGRRARELEGLLAETAYLFDIHQTKLPSEKPFFIFPYTRGGLDFAREIDPMQAVVTHWDGDFSSDGGCTDEFVNLKGGVGISFELGQNGIDPYQVGLGVSLCLSAIAVVTGHYHARALTQRVNGATLGDIYTWEAVVPFPEGQIPVFDSGWHNFRWVEEGQKLGVIGDDTFMAVSDGWIIFPKIVTPDTMPKTTPGELYRLMKKVSPADVPGG